MKIKKLVLNNIGPYVNENVFNFNVEGDNNIVLIGGKNGGGKTTFFNALKIAMYGARAFGYEGASSKYVAKLREIINTDVTYLNKKKTGIVLELFFEDDIYKPTYTIERKWILTTNSIQEECIVKKDGVILNDISRNDFELFLYNLMSPKLFNFYFFDGEHIGEYFLENNKEVNFKNSFLQLAGLDNISYMISNFNRMSLRRNKESKCVKEYLCNKKIYNESENQINIDLDNIRTINENLKRIEDEMILFEKQYYGKGRVSQKEWKILNQQLLEQEEMRANIYKQQKELANTHLPFIIMKKQLLNVVNKLNIEEENSNKKICIEELENNNFVNFLEVNGVHNAKYVFEQFKNAIGLKANDDVFGLSRLDSKNVRNKIDKKLGESIYDIELLNKKIKKSLLESKKIRELLANSNLALIEEFENKRSELLKIKDDLNKKLLLLEEEYRLHKVDMEYKKTIYEKSKKLYEEELRDRSVNNIVNRAVLAFEGFEEIIIKNQTLKVEKAFCSIFTKMINKKGFVDGIYIDKDLNVIPYVNKYIKTSELKDMLTKYSTKTVADNLSLVKKEQLNELKDTEYTKLKIENKKVFSKGERQIFIMSLYLALMSLKPLSLPFIIDTPFARIDKEHRSNIINVFFKALKGQLFILSTDEEITGKYEEELKEKISNKYLLSFIEAGKTTVVENKYFEVE